VSDSTAALKLCGPICNFGRRSKTWWAESVGALRMWSLRLHDDGDDHHRNNWSPRLSGIAQHIETAPRRLTPAHYRSL
jgi:hypothetical protein